MTENQNEALREHINRLWDEDYDFSKSSNRRNSIDTFLKSNTNFKQSSAGAAHQKQLEKIAKERGKNPAEYKGTPKAKQPAFNTELNANVNPTAADVPANSAEKGTIGPQQTPQTVQIIQQYDADTVGAVFDGFFTAMRLGAPHTEPLTDAEKKSLGQMWQGIFNQYLATNEKFGIAIAISGTLGIMGAKLIKGYQKGREEKELKKSGTPLEKEPISKKEKEPDPKKEKETPFLEQQKGISDE